MDNNKVNEFQNGFVAGYERAIEDASKWLLERLQFGCHPCNGGGLVMEFKKEMRNGQ